MVYRFDYVPKGKEEAIALYEDYGWKQIPSVNGFLLFCKPAEAAIPEDLEIFGSQQAKNDMVEKILKTRMIPLMGIWAVLVVMWAVQLFLYIAGYNNVDNVLIATICLLVISAIYIPTLKKLVALKGRV